LADWEKLIKHLDSIDETGLKPKSATSWYINGNGDNNSGSHTMLGGIRSARGTFYFVRQNGYGCPIQLMLPMMPCAIGFL
jgi:hypothetical protein